MPQARIFKKGNKVLIENIRVEAQDVLKTILKETSNQQKTMLYEAIKEENQYLTEKWNKLTKLTKEQLEQKREEFEKLIIISKMNLKSELNYKSSASSLKIGSLPN